MTSTTRALIWGRAANRCEQCGVPAVEIQGRLYGLTIHHLKARRNGGTDELDNLKLLCAPCHHTGNIESNANGRPPKPEDEKFKGRLIKAPPELWGRLDASVPERERARFVRDALVEKLDRLEKEAGE